MSRPRPFNLTRAALVLALLALLAWVGACASEPPPPPPVRTLSGTNDHFGLGAALWISAKSCNEQDVTKLLQAGAPVDIHQGPQQTTPLMEAVGSYDNKCPKTIAQMLIKAGAKVNARDARGRTPLHHLAASQCIKANMDALRFLIRAGADPTIRDHQGLTPLDLASRANCAEAIGVLADHLQKLNKARRQAVQPPWHQPPAAQSPPAGETRQPALPWDQGGPERREPPAPGTPENAVPQQGGPGEPAGARPSP